MSNQWVIDTSALILLNKIGGLKLLADLCEEVVIPKAVADELLSYKEDQLSWDLFFASSSKIKVLKDVPDFLPEITNWDLGRGESEVLSFARTHAGFEAILDDLEGRKCANTFGIPLRGTVGIIILAKKNNLITKAKPLIESLINSGLRFNIDWIKNALNLVGEDIEIR